jgi:hypothetical protein
VATGLAALLVLVTLGVRTAIVVTLVIPVVILITVFSAWVMGYSINRVFLSAFIFAIRILSNQCRACASLQGEITNRGNIPQGTPPSRASSPAAILRCAGQYTQLFWKSDSRPERFEPQPNLTSTVYAVARPRYRHPQAAPERWETSARLEEDARCDVHHVG